MNVNDLRSLNFNLPNTAEFLAAGSEQIRLPGFIIPAGYELHRSADGNDIRLIHSGYTVHCVALRETTYDVPGITNAVEGDAWRTVYCEYQSALNGYSTRLIEWLTGRYSLVIDDPCTNRFWEYRLSEAAVNPDQRVLYWDGMQATEINTFCDLSEVIWGNYSARPAGRAFVITLTSSPP